MKLTNWTGFAPSSTYRRNIDNFFGDRYRQLLDMDGDFSPPINTKELEDNYVIEIAAPGHEKEDFSITVNDGILTISSEKQSESESENGYVRREFFHSVFSQSFTLPNDIDDEHISASYENGILKVHLPRQMTPETNEAVRQINVR